MEKLLVDWVALEEKMKSLEAKVLLRYMTARCHEGTVVQQQFTLRTPKSRLQIKTLF